MIILGLTGSIAMGKSKAAAVFRRLGIPVHDADGVVHGLLAGPAVAAVGAAFPNAIRDGAVDRAALGAQVFNNAQALAHLEGILHPLVGHSEDRFLALAARRGCPLVVLDIPLLFEVGAERRCDAVVVVSAPSFVQEARVLRRPGMTRELLAVILARQMPDAEKRRRADFIVSTGLGRDFSLRAIRNIVTVVGKRRGSRWGPAARVRRKRGHA